MLRYKIIKIAAFCSLLSSSHIPSFCGSPLFALSQIIPQQVYYKPLVDIAEKNLKITNRSELCRVYHADARQFHKFRTSEKAILYVYNPFAEDVFSDILESCISIEVYLIYTDPVHQDLVQNKGFKLLYEKKGFFPNTTVFIYKKELSEIIK